MIGEDPLNIIITGVGGQGNVVASRIIASAAVNEGLYVSVGEIYGASQRGGAVTSYVRLSGEMQYGPIIPRGMAHIIIGFEPIESLRAIGNFGSKKTRAIINPRPIYPVDVLSGTLEYPPVEEVLKAIKELVYGVQVIEATELAKKAGDAVMQNIVMVGCVVGSGLIPIEIETTKEIIKESFAKERVEANLKAFKSGVGEIKGRKAI